MGNQSLVIPKTDLIGAEHGVTHTGEKWATASMQGRRLEMEDTHFQGEIPGLENHFLFAVFDGHRGDAAALYAKENILEEIVKVPSFLEYSATKDVAVLEKAMQECFLEIDKKMRVVFMENVRSGCTAIAVILTPTHIVTANAGDSRALLSRNGAVVELSQDHKPRNEIERLRIEKAEGCVFQNRVDGIFAVSRALGDFEYKDVKFSPEEFKITAFPDLNVQVRHPDDEFILLACDGIWDVSTNQEVVDRIRGFAGSEPQQMCVDLLELSIEKNSGDNLSVTIVLL